jgi:5-methyltetrahydropteroyltriglutamate--homocysteine methyltransferase
MHTNHNKILTTHAGSLPRPPSLIALHRARFSGSEVDTVAFEQAVEESTRAVVKRQLETGLDVINFLPMSNTA